MKIGVSLPVREMADDLKSIVAFAQLAEQLGYTHLRVPDQIIRPKNGHLHEPLTLMAYLAAVTEKVELVPSVIILPSRQTAFIAKQAAEIDNLSGGRLRLGIGVGGGKEEYEALGQDFSTRGARCDEQMDVLKKLWTQETVTFEGRWHKIDGLGINPLPIQRPIPMWIGAQPVPSDPVVQRIGSKADGWFVLCTPEDFPNVKGRIDAAAKDAGRNPSAIGMEAGVAVVGPREAEWKDRVKNWTDTGLTHICLRTLGGDLTIPQHLDKLKEIVDEIPRG